MIAPIVSRGVALRETKLGTVTVTETGVALSCRVTCLLTASYGYIAGCSARLMRTTAEN